MSFFVADESLKSDNFKSLKGDDGEVFSFPNDWLKESLCLDNDWLNESDEGLSTKARFGELV